MEEWEVKAIQDGSAFSIKEEQSIKEYVHGRVDFLAETLGKDYVDALVDDFYKTMVETGGAVYKSTIDQTISMAMPIMLVDVYKKLVGNAKEDLKSLTV